MSRRLSHSAHQRVAQFRITCNSYQRTAHFFHQFALLLLSGHVAIITVAIIKPAIPVCHPAGCPSRNRARSGKLRSSVENALVEAVHHRWWVHIEVAIGTKNDPVISLQNEMLPAQYHRLFQPAPPVEPSAYMPASARRMASLSLREGLPPPPPPFPDRSRCSSVLRTKLSDQGTHMI